MRERSSNPHLMDALLNDFLARWLRGERPSVEPYCERFPELAQQLRRSLCAVSTALSKPVRQTDRDEGVAGAEELILGDYRVVREVGRGGMGVVYEAEQLSLGRRVALKMLPQHMLHDPRHLQRFEREARSAARLHHSNIVPVFGIGHAETTHFFVMQFISGSGLDRIIAAMRRLETGEDLLANDAEPDCPPVLLDSSSDDDSDRDDFRTDRLRGSTAKGLQVPQNGSTFTGQNTSCDLDQTADRQPDFTAVHAAASASTAEPPDRQDSSVASRRLLADYWRNVAEIGRQVADALSYAHQQQVLHRDIKPSNLLLDANGTVWITDFGLAKTAGQNELTQPQDMLGTFRYMPPEAFDGEAGAVGDLYSLGLTLYELIALRPAFNDSDRIVLMKRVTSGDITPLEKLVPQVPRDLATIIAKATDRERTHRYQTAAEMADDLERFLRDEPVLARRVPLRERAARWARRNRPVALAVGSVAVLLVTFTLISAIAASYFRGLSADLQDSTRRLQSEQQRTMSAFQEAERLRLVAAARSDELAVQLAQGDLQRGLLLCRQGEVAAGLLWLTRSLESLPPGHPEVARAIRLNLASWQEQLCRVDMLFEHGDRVHVAVMSPDARQILTAGDGGWARLWDATTGQRGLAMQHSTTIRAGQFSPDGQLIATGSNDGNLRLWRADDAELLYSIKAHQDIIWDIAFSPNGELLATGASDGAVRLWETATGRPIGSPIRHQGAVIRVVFSPDGSQLVSASRDNTARLIDCTTAQQLGGPLQHSGTVLDAAFHPDGRSLVTGCGDGVAQVWDLSTRKPRNPRLYHGDSIHVVQYSDDGQRLLTAGDDRVARIWNSTNLTLIGEPARHSILVRSASFASSGRLFATGSDDHTARIWEVETGRPIGTPLMHQGVVRHVQFSPDQQRILTGSYDGTCRLWRLPNGRPEEITVALQGPLRRLTFSPGRELIATVSRDDIERLHAWDTRTGRETDAPLSLETEAWAIAFDESGRRITTGGYDNRLIVWDRERQSPLLVPLEHGGAVHAASFSHDGTMLLTGSRDHQAYLWNLQSGQLRIPPIDCGGRIYAVAISPDNTRLVTGTDNHGGQIWDAVTGAAVGEPLQHQGMIQSIKFSQDGNLILTGSFDRTARIWNSTTGLPAHEPMVHEGPVLSVDFSPNGATVITGSADHTAQLWDAATSLPIGPPLQHDAPVMGVAFSADGRTCQTVTESGIIRTTSVPEVLDGSSRDLSAWSEVMTGMELTPRGTLTVLKTDRWTERRSQLQASGLIPPR